MPYVRGDVFAGYTIERELGSGGMGSVYLARHPTLPRWVALKMMSPSLSADANFRSRFEREADVAADLFHRNIVTVLDRGTFDGHLWIAMQYVNGTDALQALADAGRSGFTAERAVHIVSEICAGLNMVHHQGLLHRDLKPANILLATSPDPAEPEIALLADFGIAKPIGGGQGLTATHAVVATFAYAAPEVLEGHEVDHRADIYALGCVLFELLTGRVPFPSPNVEGFISAHLVRPPPRPSDLRPDLPIGLDAVVAKAMAKAPADRFQTCRQLAVEANAALASPPAQTVAGYSRPYHPPPLDSMDQRTDPTWNRTRHETPPPTRLATTPPTPPQPTTRAPGKPGRRGPWIGAAVAATLLIAGGGYVVARQLSETGSETAAPSTTMLEPSTSESTSTEPTESPTGSEVSKPSDPPLTTNGPGNQGGGGAATGDGSFTFGSAFVPENFDPLYASDGESFRITRQIFEGLLQFKAGTTELEPALAQSWESSADGLTWTFEVRPDVTFTDGAPLDAAAVCFNFDRMYSQQATGRELAVYWADMMGGFQGEGTASLYRSCTADSMTVVLDLTRASSAMPSLLALPPFAIQSPTALTEHQADAVTSDGAAVTYPAYGTQYPTGTGPFEFVSSDGTSVELTRNDDYWGTKAASKTLVFQGISDEAARREALEAGLIDGYDLPSPSELAGLVAGGAQIATRSAFNVLYLGLNPTNNPALLDLRVRQAIAYALDRSHLVNTLLPGGSEVALEYNPANVEGWTDAVQRYDYDPAKARALLAEAGAAGITLNFWWPTNVSRPYMPDPEAIFGAFKTDLEAVGITVVETSQVWNEGYLDGIGAAKADAFLLGWTGDLPVADNFLGGIFGDPSDRLGLGLYGFAANLSSALSAAAVEPDPEVLADLYVGLNQKLIGEYLPAIPISHAPTSMVVAGNVEGLVVSPLSDERFQTVYKSS